MTTPSAGVALSQGRFGATTPPLTSGPIHIGGLDRSGKTTMAAFLSSHRNIAIPPVGSNMWTYFYRRFGDLADPGSFERCLDAMLRYRHLQLLAPDAARIRREFTHGSPSYARLFALFGEHYAERQGKPRWGVQTGLIERYAAEIFAAYPSAKVIHMLRDPRDRYEASLALWPTGRGRAGGATARWRYSLRLGERNLRRYPDRYLIVRYEDLVLHTEQTLRSVCSFLGEDFQAEMLTMSGAPERRERLAARASRPQDNSPLSAEFVGRFRNAIPRRELAFLQLHAARAMRAHGYQPERLSLSLGERTMFALVTWPSQAMRMVAWQTVETLQQRVPGIVPRRPDRRSVVAPAAKGRP